MEFAVWGYPWDVRDAGVTNVADELRSLGIDELNLATNYHSVQAIAPHNPVRDTFFARASSYFQPGDEFGRLEPVPHESMAGDWVTEIAEELDGRLTLNSWTVGCHNSRLGMLAPDVTIENARGDDLVFGLCPSTPAVQEYLVALVRDLAERSCFERIELETFDYFYGTGFGWHHQKQHVELGTLGEFLLGLCFCEACRSNAREAGVDVGIARDQVTDEIAEVLDGDADPDRSPEGWMDAHPDVAAYAEVRTRTLASLFGRLADAAGDSDLGYYAAMPEAGREWMVGADLSSLGEHVDYFCAPVYESSAAKVRDAYETVASDAGSVPVHVGVLPGDPAIDNEETVVEVVDALRAADVPRVSFYNYGLLPSKSLEWIRTAIKG